MKSPSRSGFTLVELMVTVVIIGILAAIAVPRFNGSRRIAYVATMRSDLRNLVSAQELYFSDSAHYAVDQSQLNVKPSGNTIVTLGAGPGYWTATARHTQIAGGFSCAIAVNTQNPLVSTATDGQPACAGDVSPQATRR